jgi:ADP-ribose diphosphatase
MTESLLTTRLFEVERRQYTSPDGDMLVRDIVVHPGAVTILPILDDGRIVMIHNFRHAADEELLELPAGTLELGEAPIEAAKRELEEETGYVAGEIEPFLDFFTTPGICTEFMRVFVATTSHKTQQRLDAGEQIRVSVMDRERVRRAVYDGSIRDGKTIATLGAYFLKNGS